jgi:hypothetical protein
VSLLLRHPISHPYEGRHIGTILPERGDTLGLSYQRGETHLNYLTREGRHIGTILPEREDRSRLRYQREETYWDYLTREGRHIGTILTEGETHWDYLSRQGRHIGTVLPDGGDTFGLSYNRGSTLKLPYKRMKAYGCFQIRQGRLTDVSHQNGESGTILPESVRSLSLSSLREWAK